MTPGNILGATPAMFNWSGGKDSALALWTALQTGDYEVRCLLTTLSREYARVSMHGVRENLLDRQAAAIGIPLKKAFLAEDAGMDTYNAVLRNALLEMGTEGIHTALFGDIFLEDLRAYREKNLAEAGWTAAFPLWQRPTRDLLLEFIDLGFQAVIVCVDGTRLDASFAGRLLDRSLLNDLPPDVDPCGENGEFHSFVYAGPLFREPVPFRKGEVVYRTYANAGFYFCDLIA
ncbi:Dph6-related ATP pyrophosphatase [Dinghuibacter silviterrae]|uniref:Uncharacterized protein (TIGR00290 family) n=1 Tax=Dinghuibacter silviterrae TaxID=1539049 RepID=A0A4R8DPN1_9BACT|nr:diphthine--ammonia ligase [Dinghuibacter silviterrae]TDX00080.1 uncharacterized protein (TIGR00290 family) [Dinghuibacter silviterrae]